MLGTIISAVSGVKELTDTLGLTSTQKTEIDKALAELETKVELESIKVKGEVIKAELNSKHWLPANWRALFMTGLGLVVVFHMLGIMPLLYTVFSVPYVPLSDAVVTTFFNVVMVGIGGYFGQKGAKETAKQIGKGMAAKAQVQQGVK